MGWGRDQQVESELPGQEANESCQHFSHHPLEIRPPQLRQRQRRGTGAPKPKVGGLAVTLNLTVSPGWIQKCRELLGGPSTPKTLPAHLTQQAPLITCLQASLESPIPSGPHCGPLHSVIDPDNLPLPLWVPSSRGPMMLGSGRANSQDLVLLY